VVSTIIKYTVESFSECTDVSNVVEVGRKSVPCGWATVGDKKVKVFPYSLPSVGPEADPGVQAVSPQVT